MEENGHLPTLKDTCSLFLILDVVVAAVSMATLAAWAQGGADCEGCSEEKRSALRSTKHLLKICFVSECFHLFMKVPS